MATAIESSSLIENWDEHFRVYAGPGAGKTYFLIQNIKNLINRNEKLKKSKLRKILCITYTNVAVDEINKRLNEYNQYAEVSTIHKFIADFIIRPYQKELKQIIKEEFDIGVSPDTKIASQVEGLGILHGYKKEEVFDFIKSKTGETAIPEYSISAIGDIQIDIKNFSNEEGTARLKRVKYQKEEIKQTHQSLVKEFIWDKAGRLTHDEILYFGYKLVEKYPLIAYILRINFPFIMVDEFQDTSPLQTKLIQLIGKKESIIGVVGDVAQSIYSFQGASPEFFRDFHIEGFEIKDFSISNNRRSTDNIVKFCNYLRKSSNLSQKAVLNKNNDLVTVIFDTNPESNYAKVNEMVKDSKSIVLTRSWGDSIKYAQGVDDKQKDLLKKLHSSYWNYPGDLRSDIAEHNKINWIRSLKFLITLEEASKTNCIATILKALRYYVKTDKAFKSKENLKILFEFFKLAKQFFSNIQNEENIISVIESFNSVFNGFSHKNFIMSFLKKEDSESINLLEYPLKDAEKDYDIETNNLLSQITYATGKKLVKEIFSDDSRYITTYQAKGAEYESVFAALKAVKFDKNRRGERVNISDVLLSPDTEEEEFDRLLYVACSRAINQLFVYIDCNEVKAQSIIASIEKWKKENQITGAFYEAIIW